MSIQQQETDSADQRISFLGGTQIIELPSFNKEDWFMIDEALHQVARSLRKIEQEEKCKKLNEAES